MIANFNMLVGKCVSLDRMSAIKFVTPGLWQFDITVLSFINRRAKFLDASLCSGWLFELKDVFCNQETALTLSPACATCRNSVSFVSCVAKYIVHLAAKNSSRFMLKMF